MSEAVAIRELENKVQTWPEKARSIRIVDQMTYDEATEAVLVIKALRSEIENHHEPIIRSAHTTWKTALDAKKRVEQPLEEAERILKPAIAAYERDQEAIRRELERKARELAARQAEEIKLATAVQAEDSGASEETVEQILDTPLALPVTVVAPTFQRAAGISSRQTWRAEVFDLKALAAAVAQGRAQIEMIQANLPALNGIARALKGNMNIPGVRAVADTIVNARAK